MSEIKKRILIAGIQIKLNRKEKLEDILATYVNLTNEEKQELRENFNSQVV